MYQIIPMWRPYLNPDSNRQTVHKIMTIRGHVKIWTMIVISKCDNVDNKSPHLLGIQMGTFIDDIRCILFASTNYGRGEVDGGICKIILTIWWFLKLMMGIWSTSVCIWGFPL